MRISLAVFLFLVWAIENGARAQVSCPPRLFPMPRVSSPRISGVSESCGGGRSSFVSQLPPGASGVWTADTLTGADDVRNGATLIPALVADTPNLPPLVVPVQLPVPVPPRTIITNQITFGPADSNLWSATVV